jgi:heat shock protein HslJ/predicted nucleic-acid-binding Zn-ribbon protein
MKTKMLFLSVILLLSFGCTNIGDLPKSDNDLNETQDVPLAGTRWKLSGIFDVQNKSLKVLNPADCEECYTVNFDTDSTATGKSSSNLILVDLFGKGKLIGIATEMGETGDGYLFCDAIGLLTSYSCNENELKFFYTESGKEYYLLYVKARNDSSISLTGTQWKLTGFANVTNGIIKTPEPDSENHYWIIFNDDNTLSGKSSTNELFGSYEADYKAATLRITNLGGTKIGEILDGKLFVKNLQSVYYFSIQKTSLQLYYNDTDYLLFNAIQP